ncbi:chemotaxis protein CheB [Rhodopila globiformis]|uniref:protein-glutamate methylesterase n=1 Tax=Rhodopila globiformis TaxID=1071 RepID=A0A2S6MZF4_RHOGL|nr:chemotaxis protein CheB [Rhodopila globiformis]PPQ27747.1 hypothetical protein CCS01_26525 [Rhodopila globiformis]
MSDTIAAGAPTTSGVVRVLLAITAPRTRMHIRRLLASASGIDVIGHAASASQANGLLQRGDVDFIIVEAAEDTGFVRDVLDSARNAGVEVAVLTDDSRLSSQSLTPRVHVLRPPPDITTVLPQSPFCQSLLAAVLSKARVARRPPAGAAMRPRTLRTGLPELIAIGSSTGGPQALPLVLGPLRKRIRQPIVITQHMPAAFTKLLAEHLERSTSFPTVQAADGMPLVPGRIHIAPGGRHLLFSRMDNDVVCVLDDGPPENFCKPAVDPMLRSVTALFGSRAIAVILTGMGHDGLAGCRSLVAAGGTVLAQDEATSVVWGMPGAVAQAGLCESVLPLNSLAERIVALAGASS